MIFWNGNRNLDENKNNKIEIGIISEVKWFITHWKWKYAIRLTMKYGIPAINHLFTDAKSAVVIQSFEVINFQESSRKRVIIDTNWSPGYRPLAAESLPHRRVRGRCWRWSGILGSKVSPLPSYNKQSDLGEDLMAAPTSQAYVERYFRSVASLLLGGETGWLSHWKWGRSYKTKFWALELCNYNNSSIVGYYYNWLFNVH